MRIKRIEKRRERDVRITRQRSSTRKLKEKGKERLMRNDKRIRKRAVQARKYRESSVRV